MGKVLLVYVSFHIAVSTTWETKVKKEVKREYTSKILSNIMLIFLSQILISVMSVIVNIITVIVSKKKELIITAYKLKTLCAINKITSNTIIVKISCNLVNQVY